MFRILLIAAFTLVSTIGAWAQDVYVHGYMRHDGTYVAPHYRSHPDSSYNNNWSVSPNVNPHSGQMGTRSPTWNDRAPSYGLGGTGNSLLGAPNYR